MGARARLGPVSTLNPGQCLVVMRYYAFTHANTDDSRLLPCTKDSSCRFLSDRRLQPISKLVVERVGVIHRKIWVLPAFAGTSECPAESDGVLVFPLLA